MPSATAATPLDLRAAPERPRMLAGSALWTTKLALPIFLQMLLELLGAKEITTRERDLDRGGGLVPFNFRICERHLPPVRRLLFQKGKGKGKGKAPKRPGAPMQLS